jgi:uncharacterized protein YndB with AHSA1/START domain
MLGNLIAKSSIRINLPAAKVWDALVNPAVIRQYMFGTEVVSDWTENSPIVWKGIWQDRPYEDKGIILKIEPEKMLQYTHFSPLSGAPDVPENYHTLTYELSEQGGHTNVTLSQDNNETEEDLKHSQQMWDSMLAGMKKLLEN